MLFQGVICCSKGLYAVQECLMDVRGGSLSKIGADLHHFSSILGDFQLKFAPFWRFSALICIIFARFSDPICTNSLNRIYIYETIDPPLYPIQLSSAQHSPMKMKVSFERLLNTELVRQIVLIFQIEILATICNEIVMSHNLGNCFSCG